MPYSLRMPAMRLLTGGFIALAVPHILAAQPLTLADILDRAVAKDPFAALRSARAQSADAATRQARIGPQPSIGADIEDIAGTGPYSPVDRSQSTFYYERQIERGGKRAARIGVAQAEAGLVAGQSRLRMLDFLAEVQTAWVEAQSSRAIADIAGERLAVAQRLQGEVGRRVARALDPLFAGERARAATAEAAIARDRAVEQARIDRMHLAALWRDDDVELDPAAFALKGAQARADDKAPDLALMEAGRLAARRRIDLEKARAMADPTLRAGLRHFGQGNDISVVIGGSIPLGGRRYNAGNLDRAQADYRAAEAEAALAGAARTREIARLAASREAIASQIARTDAEVLPAAEQAVRLVRDGFNRGGTAFTWLEVAEAQRSVIDARLRRIDLLKTYHLDGARLDRLTGRHLPLIENREIR